MRSGHEQGYVYRYYAMKGCLLVLYVDLMSCHSSAIYNNPYVNSISLEDIRLKTVVSRHETSPLEPPRAHGGPE